MEERNIIQAKYEYDISAIERLFNQNDINFHKIGFDKFEVRTSFLPKIKDLLKQNEIYYDII